MKNAIIAINGNAPEPMSFRLRAEAMTAGMVTDFHLSFLKSKIARIFSEVWRSGIVVQDALGHCAFPKAAGEDAILDEKRGLRPLLRTSLGLSFRSPMARLAKRP